MASTIVTTLLTTPNNVEEVTSVDQCISIEPMSDMFIVYKIGDENVGLAKTFTVTNITTNADFIMTIQLPMFLKSDVPTSCILPKNSSLTVTIFLDESKIKDIVLFSKNIESKIIWKFDSPTITGPIYI